VAAYVPGFLREVGVIFSCSPLPSRIAPVAEALLDRVHHRSELAAARIRRLAEQVELLGPELFDLAHRDAEQAHRFADRGRAPQLDRDLAPPEAGVRALPRRSAM
jgi:hypothetical protein